MANEATELRKCTAAPVAMFVHARPNHTARTFEALAQNNRAQETDLYVFADAARHEREVAAVQAVRRLAVEARGFKSVTVIERPFNLGLAGNITDGVTSVVERHGKVIVLEDDLVTGPYFLEFLNDALDRYENDRRVWHVNGWTYPIDLGVERTAFFTSVMECWGWATWADRWSQFRKDPVAALQAFSPAEVHRFNIGGGYDYWADIKRNALGTMNTWAVFWYATIFKADGLCVSPPQSHVMNIGIDGSGTNSGSGDLYSATVVDRDYEPRWPSEVASHEGAWQATRAFLLRQRPAWWKRLASRIKWAAKGIGRRFRSS